MNPLIGYPAAGRAAGIPVHYPCAQASRSALTLAILLSLGTHLCVLFGLSPGKKPPAAKPADVAPVEAITIFKPEELEEPEPVPADDAPTPAEEATLLPVQVDTPAVAKLNDFVQPLDLSSLLPRPDADPNLKAIPAHFTRTPNRRARGPIFSPGDLDRTPVAIAQPAPPYPHAMRREALTATVVVGFIVDTAGAVMNPHVVDSTHSGFNDAAVSGVSKWKFRAGIRGGRTVNTRMHVPIVFRLAE